MISAKNNIIVKINNSNDAEYAILNPVSGSFDLMGEDEYRFLSMLDKGEALPDSLSSYLLERGYAYHSSEEQEKAIDKAYSDFNNEIANSQVQLMLVPTYGCNLACTYCFQHGIDDRPTLITREIVDAFFDYAGATFLSTSKKPFITLFGGEPLVNSPAQRAIIEYIVEKCSAENYELSAVTNGYDFTEYVDILKRAKIKEIQFTLDGSRDVHDLRRATANKKGTFDKIIKGIAAAVENKIPVNLRSVVDIENIEDLVNLAEYLDKMGWLELPPELFKTQIGRNYELFECYAKPQHLMTELELWGQISSLSKSYPILSKLHRPDFKGIRHIVDTGEMYMASFDTCPACKTEWVFDLYGEIYGCTASCGRKEHLLGTYWPKVDLNNDRIELWKSRNVKNISKCRNCKYDVICGGGCGVVAANHSEGNILSPDCRPIQGLIELGVNHYISELTALSDNDAEPAAISEDRSDTASKSCCCGNEKPQEKKTKNCMICGGELVYSTSPAKMSCNICGETLDSYARCHNGHYVCDTCHSLDILEKVKQFLFTSSDTDPIKLAQQVFELQGLNMHGPEYHSIVPAILIAAWQNKNRLKNITTIGEAIKRGKDIKGGSCGFLGSCGAGIGAGIAVSIIEKATPMSVVQRGIANMVTAYSLLEISKYGGPRCCKREAILTIKAFMQQTDYFNDQQNTEYICKQHGDNKTCIMNKCPFYPVK